MEGVVNNPFVGQEYIQYGKFTFKNETGKLQTLSLSGEDLLRMDGCTVSLKGDAASWKACFSDIALGRSPVADAKKEVDAETDAVINGFFDGTVSAAELSERFQALAGKLSDACKEAGYPIPLAFSREITQSFTETFYSEFRRKILNTALQRNNQEGQQYLTGQMNAQRSWKYYNSDYYFKSEEAISAITDGLDKIAQDAAVNRFLQNFQVYPQGHFSRFPLSLGGFSISV